MASCRVYDDLAWLWPLWGDVEEYRRETDSLADLARRHAAREVRSLLDVACGGGKNLFHFRRHFETAGLDMSRAMLDHARRMNPSSDLIFADMRDFDLGRQLDAIYLNDGHAHLTSRADLGRTFGCAYRHLRPGGVVLSVAEFTKERPLQPEMTVTRGIRSPDRPGTEVVFIESHHDPDPSDETFETSVLYVIREGGEIRIERDGWTAGRFPIEAWKELLSAAGLRVALEERVEGLEGLPVLVGTKPT